MATDATPTPVKVVLLDIEGTVCPISFVKDVLFPYALQALPGVLESKWDSPQFAPYRNAFPAEYQSSKSTFTDHVKDLMERDVKASYLKSLQGYLWETGYKSGDLTAPLFQDVALMMESWRKARVRIMIYSSGSVPAQKLLFKHTNAPSRDLIPLITDFFDTVNAGPKTEAASYEKIADQYKRYHRNEWLFLSDNVKECQAAVEAGMQSYIVQRPGNADLPKGIEGKYRVIRSFDELALG